MASKDSKLTREQTPTPDSEADTTGERQDAAYQRHLQGQSYRTIAAALRIDTKTVMRWVRAARRATAPRRKQDREQALGEAIARLREIQRAAWVAHDSRQDASALNTALAAEREIARLLGLYEPMKIDHNGGVTVRIEHTTDWRGHSYGHEANGDAEQGG